MGDRLDDRASWLARYVMPHEMALRRWLGSRRFNGIDVDEIIQETYAILCEIKSVEHIRDPKQYAFQTAYSIILAQLRRSRIVSIATVANLEELSAAADAPSAECQVCDREELRAVEDVIMNLPERVRNIFVLRRIEGMSQREVAQRLGVSENVVEKGVGQGVRALMTAFKRGGKSRADTHSPKTTPVSNGPPARMLSKWNAEK